MVDVVSSNMPKTLHDRHVQDLDLIESRASLDLGNACLLVWRRVTSGSLISFGLDFSQIMVTENSGTYRRLWSDKLSLAIHHSGDARTRVVGAQVSIRKWNVCSLRRDKIRIRYGNV